MGLRVKALQETFGTNNESNAQLAPSLNPKALKLAKLVSW